MTVGTERRVSVDGQEEVKWDKLQKWRLVQEDILQKLQTPDQLNQSMTLHHGPQVHFLTLLSTQTTLTLSPLQTALV